MAVKITSMTYTRGATINTGNFENVRHDVSVTIQIEGDDPDAAFENIKQWAKAKLNSVVRDMG